MRGTAVARRNWLISFRSDSGAAVTEYALISIVVSMFFLGVLQLGFALYIRNTALDAAVQGAQVAATIGGTDADAYTATRAAMEDMLTDSLVTKIEVKRSAIGGLGMVEVSVSTRLPVVGPLGPGGAMQQTARVIEEESFR